MATVVMEICDIFCRTKVLRYCISLYVNIKVDYCVFYVPSTSVFNVSWCYSLTVTGWSSVGCPFLITYLTVCLLIGLYGCCSHCLWYWCIAFHYMFILSCTSDSLWLSDFCGTNVLCILSVSCILHTKYKSVKCRCYNFYHVCITMTILSGRLSVCQMK